MSVRDIYFAISEMAVGDVPCRNRDEIKLKVNLTDTPVRLLVPILEADIEFSGIGALTHTTYRIRDVCLWQAVVAGTGSEQCADEMAAFCDLYQAGIRGLRNPTPGSHISRVEIKEPDHISWGGVDFFGFETIITVEEYDP